MPIKKKILFFIHGLGYGGEERIITDLMKFLDESRFQQELYIYLDRKELVSELPSSVRVVPHEKKTKIGVLKLIWKIGRELDGYRPHTVLVTNWYDAFLVIIASWISGCHFYLIMREAHCTRNDVSEYGVFSGMKKSLIRFVHRFPDLFVCVSRGVADDVKRQYGVHENKIRVIHNWVKLDKIKHLAGKPPQDNDFLHYPGKSVAAMGRLVKCKGFDLLIRSFKSVCDEIDAVLFIIGEGRERESLEHLISELGMKNRVFLPGNKSNPFSFISRADIFVSSSLHEGFGNAILEAMACGMPVISTDCPFGPREIIEHCVNGILIPSKDEAALATAIVDLLNDEEKKRNLSHAAEKRAGEFAQEKLICLHEEILNFR